MKDTTEVLIANGSVIGLSLGECNDDSSFNINNIGDYIFTIYKFIKLKKQK